MKIGSSAICQDGCKRPLFYYCQFANHLCTHTLCLLRACRHSEPLLRPASTRRYSLLRRRDLESAMFPFLQNVISHSHVASCRLHGRASSRCRLHQFLLLSTRLPRPVHKHPQLWRFVARIKDCAESDRSKRKGSNWSVSKTLSTHVDEVNPGEYVSCKS